jgi:hypothetical protein
MSSSPDLSSIIALMTDYLSTEQLKLVLLNAIPQRELRWFQPPTPPGRPGLRVQPRPPPPVWGEFYAPGVEQQFPDWVALDYLEYMRSVVLAQNPDEDADTLNFLLEEYDEYFAKGPPSVPDFFRPVLILFKKWHERSGNPFMAVDTHPHDSHPTHPTHTPAEPANPPLSNNLVNLLHRMSLIHAEK